MNIKDKIKNAIIENYNKLNQNSADFIDLNTPAKNLEDPFFKEFKKAIIDSIRLKNEDDKITDVTEIKTEDTKINEELNALYKEDEELDPNLLNRIELKVSGILKKLNIEFYENEKEKLKEILIKDIEAYEIPQDLSKIKKEKIVNKIGNLIEQEIIEYKSKKEYRKKELLKDLLQKINPLVNDFFEKNNHEKLIKMTLFQRKNLINYFFENINYKYIQSEFLNKNINELEFKFLRSKVHSFIINRYEKILSEKL
jgi:hypothetical protein